MLSWILGIMFINIFFQITIHLIFHHLFIPIIKNGDIYEFKFIYFLLKNKFQISWIVNETNINVQFNIENYKIKIIY